ncbi:MAG TPA: hypothetical protein ENI73_00510 [Spirochaetes bacterium]|nr:hypothetical protein [Spirochaetota bacterium]
MKVFIFLLGCILIYSCHAEPAKDTMKKALKAPNPSIGNVKLLVQRKRCINCHDMRQKLLGPSFIDIKGRYKNKPEGKELLMKGLLEGSKGKWGNVVMFPQNNLSKVEAEAIIEWILALK